MFFCLRTKREIKFSILDRGNFFYFYFFFSFLKQIQDDKELYWFDRSYIRLFSVALI